MNAGLIVFIVLIVLAFLGLPIFEAIAAGTMLAMWFGGFPLETMAQKTFLGLNSSSLLSIPFFILAGNLMARGITQKLIGVANVLLGRVRGALGSVTVLASALFGAISGSAVATVAAIGGMTIPAMKDEGYDPDYSAALSSAASLLGPMIPPSITLIVYAGLTEASVQKLFLATLTPAILCTVAFLAYTLWYGKKKNLPKQPKKTAKEAGKIMLDAIWALLLPVIVLGLIFSGATTVTEAAAVSCLYSAIVSLFIYKTITFKDLLKILGDSAVSIAAIMILVGMSKATAYVVISSQMPQLVHGFHHLHHRQPLRGAADHQRDLPDPRLPDGRQLHHRDDGAAAADAGEVLRHRPAAVRRHVRHQHLYRLHHPAGGRVPAAGL